MSWKSCFRCLCVVSFAVFFSHAAFSVIDIYKFESDVEKQRYLSFIEELRCPKCQNQNLAGSDSPIAEDLRRELYRMLQDGRSDKEITDFMVDRYGEYVLYRPQVKQNTYMLWGLPLVLLLLGVGTVVMIVRGRSSRSSLDLARTSVTGDERLSNRVSTNESDSDELGRQERLSRLLDEADARRDSSKNS